MKWFSVILTMFLIGSFAEAKDLFKIIKVSKNKKSVMVKYRSKSKVKAGMLFEVIGGKEEECRLLVRKANKSQILLDANKCLDKELLRPGRALIKSSLYKDTPPSQNQIPGVHLVGPQRGMELSFYYSAGTKIIEEAKGTLGSTAYDVEIEVSTGGGLGLELGYGEYNPNGSGYRFNGYYEFMRTVSNTESKLNGVPNSSTTFDPKPIVSILGLSADYVYTLPNFVYMTLGINLSKMTITDVSEILVRQLDFNLGFQMSAGYRFSANSSAELGYRYYKSSGDVNLGASNQTYKVSALSLSTIVLAYKYHF